MYKACQNKKYYLAINTFRKVAKKMKMENRKNVYITGFHKWVSDDMVTYSIVIGTFRVMFGIKTPYTCCDSQH